MTVIRLIRGGIVKTRKDHTCHGCRKMIPKGSKAYSQTNVFDGMLYTIYMCDECRNHCRGCTDCYNDESAYEGFIAECKATAG